MVDDDLDESTHDAGMTALQRLRAQLLQTESATDADAAELDGYLEQQLCVAGDAEPEVLTVMNPVSRPVRLKLAEVLIDPDLDSMYGKESAQLAISEDGVCYLIYRRSDGGDYAVVWSPATLMSPTTMAKLPEILARVMLGGAR